MTLPAVRVAAFSLTAVIAAACGGTTGSSLASAPVVSFALPESPEELSLTATPTVSPPEPLSFASARYGYRLQAPADWTVSETPGTGGTHPDEAGVDTFRDREGHILSVVGERATGLENWSCAINRHLVSGEHRLTVENTEAIDVGGVAGRVAEYHLEIRPYVIHYLTVETVRDGLGLTLSLESTTKRDVEDRAVLDSLLETFEWT